MASTKALVGRNIWPTLDDFAVASIVVYLAPISLPTFVSILEIWWNGYSTLGTEPEEPKIPVENNK